MRTSWHPNHYVGDHGLSRSLPGDVGALNSSLCNHLQTHRAAFTAAELKRLAWWFNLACQPNGYYDGHCVEVEGIRWRRHQELDPTNPIGLELPPGTDQPRLENTP